MTSLYHGTDVRRHRLNYCSAQSDRCRQCSVTQRNGRASEPSEADEQPIVRPARPRVVTGIHVVVSAFDLRVGRLGTLSVSARYKDAGGYTG